MKHREQTVMNFGAVAFGHQSAKHLHRSDFGDEGVVIDLGRANGNAGTIVVEPIGDRARCAPTEDSSNDDP